MYHCQDENLDSNEIKAEPWPWLFWFSSNQTICVGLAHLKRALHSILGWKSSHRRDSMTRAHRVLFYWSWICFQYFLLLVKVCPAVRQQSVRSNCSSAVCLPIWTCGLIFFTKSGGWGGRSVVTPHKHDSLFIGSWYMVRQGSHNNGLTHAIINSYTNTTIGWFIEFLCEREAVTMWCC